MEEVLRTQSAAVTVGVVLVAVLVFAIVGVGDLPGSMNGPVASENGSESEQSSDPSPRFRNATAGSGFDYVSKSPPSVILNGGVYVVDYNADDWPDLITTGGSEPVLFENTEGQFDPTGKLPDIDGSVEAVHVFDYDNDATQDILLLARDRSPVLLENRDGQLVRRPDAFQTNMTYPAGATSADYDGDGCLDVFVFQYADWADKRPAGTEDPDVRAGEDDGNPNALFRGNCQGSFTRVSAPSIEGSHWTLAASFFDFTGDGRPDIHVANDYARDVRYVNRGGGSFERIPLGNETNRNAMSSEVTDVNGDGRFDVFVTNIALPSLVEQNSGNLESRMGGNNLLVNREGETFEDTAKQYNVQEGGWGWAAVSADFDGDADQELFHTNAQIALTAEMQSQIVKQQDMSVSEYIDEHPSVVYPMFFERKNGTFAKRSASRVGFEKASGTGVARLDFDRDGDPDLAVAQVSGRFLLYENTASDPGNWIRVGVRSGTQLPKTGARVTITVNGEKQRRLVNSRADLLSQDSRVVHFGVADADTVDRVQVEWPDGTTVVRTNVSTGQRVVIGPE